MLTLQHVSRLAGISFTLILLALGSHAAAAPLTVLFSGVIIDRGWQAATGDLVYGSSIDEETKEQIVVRYRLVEPF